MLACVASIRALSGGIHRSPSRWRYQHESPSGQEPYLWGINPPPRPAILPLTLSWTEARHGMNLAVLVCLVCWCFETLHHSHMCGLFYQLIVLLTSFDHFELIWLKMFSFSLFEPASSALGCCAKFEIIPSCLEQWQCSIAALIEPPHGEPKCSICFVCIDRFDNQYVFVMLIVNQRLLSCVVISITNIAW